MSDNQRAMAVDAEGEAPVNPYSLLEALNDSSDTVHTGWLIFIAIMSYLLVAVAGVTHKDLLLSRDIPLPLLQVPIELTRFFLFAPIVLVLFHVGIVTQLVMLARKAIELDRSLRILESTDRRTHPLRLELHNFFFVQAIAGPERSSIVNGLLHGLTWLTLVVLPVVLLLYIQISFLPYHDVTITWAHRIALVTDIAMLALLGVFLSRPEQSLGGALLRAGLDHPLTSFFTVSVLGGVAIFSFLVATVPGERLDRLGREWLGTSGSPGALGQGPAAYGFVLPFFGHSADGRLFGLFERNLNVTDLDLVNDKDVTPGEPTLNLRRRDLRYARLDRTDIHQADLTGANLDGASLVGADLRNVTLHCADVSLLLLSDDREAASCPSARGANFTKARLRDASLAGLDLDGSRLEEADLVGARLAHASLIGANLYSARLSRANLTGGVPMMGANLGTAALEGADLTGAKLHGADLTSAGLQGASLEFVSLHGATLDDADLEGASLVQARLPGARLTGASVTAASLRGAWIWHTAPPAPEQADLAEFTELRTTAPSEAELKALDDLLAGVSDTGLRSRLRSSLKVVRDGGAANPVQPNERDNIRIWGELLNGSRQSIAGVGGESVPTGSSVSPGSALLAGAATGVTQQPGDGSTLTPPRPVLARPDQGSFRLRLTRHLGDLACKVRWAEGSLATGLARRAQGFAFSGDIATLYERLRAPSCPASLTISSSVLKSLATKVDAERRR